MPNGTKIQSSHTCDLLLADFPPQAVNTSGKAGAQIPHLPLGDDSSPWVGIIQYVFNLTRFTRLCVTSHSQPLINTKYKFQVTNYLQTIF
jgi:hypothetical protein